MFYFYLLQSVKKRNEIYTGSTNDLRFRLNQHNQGKVFSTKKYLPWRLIYYEAYLSEKDARLREQKFKRHGKGNQEFKKRLEYSLNSLKRGLPLTFLAKKGEGFTLAEILVTMAIFVTAVTAVANIVLYSNRLQRQTQALQDTQSDARYSLEVIAQQIRRGNIDYQYYGGGIGTSPQNVLALLNRDGQQIQFKRVESGGRGEIQIWQEGDQDWTAITPPKISIANLQFYISPSSDPFAEGYSENIQPLVTVVLNSVNISVAGQNLTPIYLQTSIASRQYLR